MRRRDLIIGGTAAAGISAAGFAYWSEHRSTGKVMAKAGPRRFTSAGGLVDVELTAARARFQLAGRAATGMAFNGQVPGPVIEAHPGDTVRIAFHNALEDPTNLHYHGLHVSPSGKADNIFLRIPPGESFDYEFQIPNDPAGLFWYHPHLHGLVAGHVSQGLAGIFVIRGELDRISEIAAATEHFLVLQDWDLGRDGSVLGASMPERMMMGREGALVTVNAELAPVLEIPAGRLLRLRWLNASSSRFYLFGTDGPPMHLAAVDGGGLPALRSVDRLLLAPGERADVLVQGEMSIRNFAYDRGSMGMMGMMAAGAWVACGAGVQRRRRAVGLVSRSCCAFVQSAGRQKQCRCPSRSSASIRSQRHRRRAPSLWGCVWVWA